MLKLKTNTEFIVPVENVRGNITAIVRIIIESLFEDSNNYRIEGYYYVIDENGQVLKLVNGKIDILKLKSDIRLFETTLPVLESNVHVSDNTLQRLAEMTFAQIELEGDTNYGTVRADYVIDND